jgi:DNA-binding NtrC family response regulator
LPHDATTLVLGETGTGKEVLARALHEGGPRRHAPFVPVNCAALPGALIESELFGHERGAFTDAHAAKPGLFEVAGGGTLFLDEIGTPAGVQAKLLRVLDDTRSAGGGTRARAFDVAHRRHQRKPRGGVRRGAFGRPVLPAERHHHVLPPLRERDHDVILIARHLLHRLAAEHGLPEPLLDVEARSALLGHHWPGNVRELKNAVERALFLSAPGPLRPEDLISSPGAPPPVGNGALPFPATLRRITAAAASATLARCGGNRSEAARQLAVSRRRLARLLAASTQKSREIPCA